MSLATPTTFAVIFDNDGVLVDSEPFSIAAYQRAIEEQGVKLSGDDLERNCGLTDADIIADMKTTYGADLDLDLFSQRKAILYRELAEASPMHLFPGTLALIHELQRRSIPFALASSGSREKIAFNLQRAGIHEHFDHIISGEDFHRGKPDPEIFLKAAEVLEMSPERCVVIEDSINGLKAARAAGCFALAVTNTFPAENLRPYADLVVSSLESITVPRIEKLLGLVTQ